MIINICLIRTIREIRISPAGFGLTAISLPFLMLIQPILDADLLILEKLFNFVAYCESNGYKMTFIVTDF